MSKLATKEQIERVRVSGRCWRESEVYWRHNLGPQATIRTAQTEADARDAVCNAAELAREAVELLRRWTGGCPTPPRWHWSYQLSADTARLLAEAKEKPNG